MTISPGWNPVTAVAACPVIPWRGLVWRAHRRKYAATDPGGSLRVSGRYHRGGDQFPPDAVWPALYLALGPEICLGEILRHITPTLLPRLNDYRITELAVVAHALLDCRDTAPLGIAPDALWHDTDYRVPQATAAAAVARGMEGLLVPSATRLGNTLVLFTGQLRTSTTLVEVVSRDPMLYVPRA